MPYITWNTWHGCYKCSEGCTNCYVYAKDKEFNIDSSEVRKVKTKFNLPLQRNRQREFKVPIGSRVGVCLTSDFFLEEADQWREDVWEIIKYRKDCKFFIITKRPERIIECLPKD